MEFPRNIRIEVTFTDIDLHLFALLAGIPLLDLIDTPQNRDFARRATLQKADS